MTNVYFDSEQKYLAKTVLYAKKTSDGFIYADEKTTVKVSHDNLLDLCMKGLVIVKQVEGAFMYPVYFKDASGTVTVTVATKVGASDSAVLDLKSKEPTA